MAQGFAKVIEKDLAIQIDEAANGITYVGKAQPGSATSAAVWQICRIDESGTTEVELIITWADGNKNFDKIWDNRTTYSYS